ncbi:MAG: helix-turn-helix domain-containing protein [Acidobacteriota bacterium]
MAKRKMIIDAAIRHFAKHGYQDTRVEDIALKLGIAKGSIFQHFGSKEGLFLECYKKAVRALGTYMDLPADVLEQGFFASVRYWLEWSERLSQDAMIAFRVSVIGEYGTSMTLKREVTRFLETEDPYRVKDFIRMGIERGELRDDVDPLLLNISLRWLVECFQDAVVAEELDPGLFHDSEGRRLEVKTHLEQYLQLLRGALARR